MALRKKLAFAIVLALAGPSAFAETKITSIDFKVEGGQSRIEVKADGPLTFEKTENSADKQVLVQLTGATLAKGLERKLDTSSFDSRVSLVSPYQVPDQPGVVRLVVQLRDTAPAEVTQADGTLVISVPNAGGGAAPDGAAAATAAAAPETPPAPESPPAAPADPAAAAGGDAQKLDSLMQSVESRRFTGKPVTLQVRDAEIADVFRLIGEASGFNIIVGEDVKGKISLSLVDVPWDQALDVILHTRQLGAERNQNVLRIVSLDSMVKEKQAELAAKQAAEASAPRVTRVFPISYAKLADLKALLEKLVSRVGTTGATGGGDATAATVIMVDERTNSLVVRDLPENIDRMKKIIELLDTQTPQVLVEAKVIEASETFSKVISGQFGFGGTGSSMFFGSVAGSNPTDALIGEGGVFTTGKDISVTSADSSGNGSGSFGFSPKVGFIPGLTRLNALLNLGESEGTVKVVSTPKTVVLNKEAASIIAGTPVSVKGTTTVNGVGTVPVEEVKTANLSLDVKPSVTNDGSVLMELKIQRDAPQFPGIATRNMTTKVLVDSGSTLVIGGIYETRTEFRASGLPILRKIPVIGSLFGSESNGTERKELFIFISPRVLNEKEAGISG